VFYIKNLNILNMGVNGEMKRTFWIFVIVLFQLSGCANTQSGEGFDLVDDNEYAKALPYFERAATENSGKSSAVMASFLYLSDYQIPRDIDKAKEYYNLALTLDYGRYDQYLDYFTSFASSKIMLYDDVDENDSEATDILRGERYSEYSSALGLLAKSYAFGKGVNKNIKISKLLFDRAVEYDEYVYSSHHYAWWLAVHPSEDFRDGPKALTLMKEVMNDEDESGRATTLDTMAAVWAENGVFDKAIDTQKKAIVQLKNDSQDYPDFKVWENWFECRLGSYEQKTAWHYEMNQTPFAGSSDSEPCE